MKVPGAVVMGGSAGGIEALEAILPKLPAGYPLPVVLVLHLPPDRASQLVEIFGRRCTMQVCEADHCQGLEPGVIYFAPPNYHLQIEPNLSLSLSVDEPVLFSRPAIDVLFQSAAYAFRDRLLGVLLSGASRDGAEGLRTILDCGGRAIVQDPSSAAYGIMPKSAVDCCPEAQVLSLMGIAERMLGYSSLGVA